MANDYTLTRAEYHRQILIARDGPGCQWPHCENETDLTRHHLIPESLGGRTIPANMVLLCSDCHSLVHKFLRLPDPGQRRRLKPRYSVAWQQWHETLAERRETV